MMVLSWKELFPCSLLVVTTVSCSSPPLTENRADLSGGGWEEVGSVGWGWARDHVQLRNGAGRGAGTKLC